MFLVYFKVPVLYILDISGYNMQSFLKEAKLRGLGSALCQSDYL